MERQTEIELVTLVSSSKTSTDPANKWKKFAKLLTPPASTGYSKKQIACLTATFPLAHCYSLLFYMDGARFGDELAGTWLKYSLGILGYISHLPLFLSTNAKELERVSTQKCARPWISMEAPALAGTAAMATITYETMNHSPLPLIGKVSRPVQIGITGATLASRYLLNKYGQWGLYNRFFMPNTSKEKRMILIKKLNEKLSIDKQLTEIEINLLSEGKLQRLPKWHKQINNLLVPIGFLGLLASVAAVKEDVQDIEPDTSNDALEILEQIFAYAMSLLMNSPAFAMTAFSMLSTGDVLGTLFYGRDILKELPSESILNRFIKISFYLIAIFIAFWCSTTAIELAEQFVDLSAIIGEIAQTIFSVLCALGPAVVVGLPIAQLFCYLYASIITQPSTLQLLAEASDEQYTQDIFLLIKQISQTPGPLLDKNYDDLLTEINNLSSMNEDEEAQLLAITSPEEEEKEKTDDDNELTSLNL